MIVLRPSVIRHKFRLYPRFTAGRPLGVPYDIAIQAMEMNVTKKNTAIGLLHRGRPESLFGPSGADQRKAQDGCQNGQPWLDAF